MYGKWLNKVINKVPNIQRWQDKTTILRKNCDAYPSVFYRKYVPYINNTFYILK